MLQWYFCSTAAANDGAVGFDPTDTSLHFDGEMECKLEIVTAPFDVHKQSDLAVHLNTMSSEADLQAMDVGMANGTAPVSAV